MDKHITLLGVLHIAHSALGVIAAIIVFTVVAGGGFISGDVEAMAITAMVASSIALFLLVLSIPGIVGGIGLLKLHSWARILVLVLGFLNLINIPVGTALGIYSIWVLFNDEARDLFFTGSVPGRAGP